MDGLQDEWDGRMDRGRIDDGPMTSFRLYKVVSHGAVVGSELVSLQFEGQQI